MAIRAFGMVIVLVALGLTAVLFSKESKQLDSSSSTVKHAEEPVAIAAVPIFMPVAQVLRVEYEETGTYVGARLPSGSGVVLVQATNAAYCLQASLKGKPVHQIGPGGVAEPGPC